MAVKVAINGFGRIGRLAFRQMFNAEGYEVVAINDLTNPKMLAHLLKYDSAQGKYALADTVEAGEDSITVDGKEIKIYAKANAAELPWGEIGVDVVLECTGFYVSKAKSQAHIDAGAKKVVISAPAGNDLPTIVFGVNEGTLKASDTIISAASCTTNCLAPMANALNNLAPIKSGIMLTVHAYTGDQMVLDGPHRKGDLRRARAAGAAGHGQHTRAQRLRNHDLGEDAAEAHAERAGGFHLTDANGVYAAHKVFGTKGRAQKDRGDDNAGAVGQDDFERRQCVDDDDEQRDAGDVTEDLDIQVAKDAQRLER